MLALILLSSLAGVNNVSAQGVPAGCPGGPPGPPAANIECPDVIENASDAAAFCRTLPGGFFSTRWQTCYFTHPDAEGICQVDTAQSFPAPNAHCAQMHLNTMRNQTSDNLRQFVGYGNQNGEGEPTGAGDAARARNTCNELPLRADDNCPLLKNYIIPAIRILSISVGVIVATMIVWGGIKYASSRDNPQQTASAKEHVRNALIGLVLYIFMVAFLNWVVPGGVLF